jgi:prepilin-type processing-associated H-X9-DG protein
VENIPEISRDVPLYTAKRYSQLDKNAPYATDYLWWSQSSMVHKSGVTPNDRIINGGINALFKDGHVRFVRDEQVTYKYSRSVLTGTVFNNRYWDELIDPPGGAPTDDARVIFYFIYQLIKP